MTMETEGTSLRDLLSLIWRRRLIVGGVTLLTILAAVAALSVVEPVYEAKATVSISPGLDTDQLLFLNSIDQIVPVYAEAVTLRSTQDAARERAGRLGEISVATFEQTPIFEIRVRDTDRVAAQSAAQALAETLEERVARGEVGIPSLEIQQLDRPEVPQDPVFPQPNLTLMVAAVLGLGLGISAGALRETLTRKVETVEHLAEVAGVPSYAELPRTPAIARMNSLDELFEDHRFAFFSESIRDLRTNLLFSVDGMRSMLVTSPEGIGHGKTTVATALAANFARLGVSTLLIDGDLRRGRIAEIFSLPRDPGLMEALSGRPIDDVIRKTSVENLDVVCSGKAIEDPGEVFESNFLAVLKRLETNYECVVVDAPPLVAVNDARIMARYVDATIMVTGANQATRNQVRAAVERLKIIGAELTAVVLNRSRKRRGSSYYAYLENAPKRQPSS